MGAHPCARSPIPVSSRQASTLFRAPLTSSSQSPTSMMRPSTAFNPAPSMSRIHIRSRSQRPVLIVRATDKDQEGPASSRPGTDPPSAAPGPEPGPSSSQQEEARVAQQMERVWSEIKITAKQNLPEEEATMLDMVSMSDIETGAWARKLADAQLGPVLAAMGVDEDPLDFFLDVIRTLLFMQLLSMGTLFYSAELLWHADTGEAFRAVSGLGLGYLLRPFFRVEQLLAPVYNWGVELFFPNISLQITQPSREEAQSTVNRLSILIAAAYFLPQAALHWHASDCTQLVGPAALGLLLFDVFFMITLLLKLRML